MGFVLKEPDQSKTMSNSLPSVTSVLKVLVRVSMVTLNDIVS